MMRFLRNELSLFVFNLTFLFICVLFTQSHVSVNSPMEGGGGPPGVKDRGCRSYLLGVKRFKI